MGHVGVLISLYFLSQATALFFPYPQIFLEARKDAGKPLILTPYLKNGSIQLAQNLSRVSITDKLGFRSHSGFFTVDKKYNSNLYFWYFPPFTQNSAAPVILWLQGGPGGSSLFGLFTENGPLIAKKNGFGVRKYHWALNYHLIYIDNPVGTGFSFTDSDKGYCMDENCIARNLYESLHQFFIMFPKLSSNEFYITGESYAGKYIPALGMEIYNRNQKSKFKISLQGMAMGNAYCDPINQMDYGKYLYQHGLIDNKQLTIFEAMQAKIAKEIKNENWGDADILMDKLMDGDLTNFSYFKNYTGFKNYYNILKIEDDLDTNVLFALLDDVNVRKSVHVGGLPFNSGKDVQVHLLYDILKSVAPYVSQLLSEYHIMFYNGQLDIIVAYPLTENFLLNLNFTTVEDYKIAPRKIWRVSGDVAGYVKRSGNLTEVLVRNAGHMVPHDQPKWALDLITRFIQKKFLIK